MVTQQIKKRRQRQILQKEHEGVNCQKTILQTIKEDRVIKKTKSPEGIKTLARISVTVFTFRCRKTTVIKKKRGGDLSQNAKTCFAY
jgi:hypothetical protein